jgi:hypothetical protein
MIEDWIDEQCKVWESIDLGEFKSVRSYRLAGAADFPAAITPSELDLHPVVLTIPSSMMPEYSLGGPREGIYAGVSEFHVAPDVDKARLPALLPWYGMILRAAAAHMKLNNKVVHFAIEKQEGAIAGPLALKYGDENPHWGFIVQWTVKEKLNGLIVSA